MKMNLKIILSSLLIGLISYVEDCQAIAVMSVDIGSEWIKVAIVSPGVPMEIVLNKESKRKTPAAIAFRDGERLFGEDALGVGVKFPHKCFSYILDLVGKSIDNPIVELYKKRFPHYEIVAIDNRKTIGFKLDDDNIFTPEELLAQLLQQAREFAEISADQKINKAVITVPGFLNQAERKAILQAAELANIKVLQLINDYTAVALNYGIFHSKKINDSAQYIMFYDMGASSTTATIVSYQNVKTKERGFVETHPQISILGVGYDRTLGGLEKQIRLQNYLAQEFDKMGKSKTSVFKNPRAMAKLFKEAGRLKNVLSANADHFAQIESLIDDIDFKFHVTREKFEELCSDLESRIIEPIKRAFDASSLTLDIISQVVLVGAATRMPKVHDILTNYFKRDLSKNINRDEAAVLGAVYKAAELSQGFKVKKFITKDAVLFPIQIVFDKSPEDNTKKVRRTLFGKMNAYPQKKIITFNKRKNDFHFTVNYADLDHLPPHELKVLKDLNISKILLKNVGEAFEKISKENAESKGIKTHFLMDDSGLLHLLNAELHAEKIIPTEVKDEGTFSMLKSTISQFFPGSEEPETVEKMDEPPKEDIKPVHEEPDEGTPNKVSSNEDKSINKNDTKIDDKKKNNQTDSKVDKKIAVTVLKETIQTFEERYGPMQMDEETFQAARKKLKMLDKTDMEKRNREIALNQLEAYVFDAQQKLMSDEYQNAADNKEVQIIKDTCDDISKWLDEEGFNASAEEYENKLKELKKLTDQLYERVNEHRERPEALSEMSNMINISSNFLNNIKNLNVTNQIFTQVEIETLEKTINNTILYQTEVLRIVAKTPLNEPVKYKVHDINNQTALLDREVKYLVHKAQIWKPKQEAQTAKVNKTETTVNETESIVNDTTTDTDDQIVIEAIDKTSADSETPQLDDTKEPELQDNEIKDNSGDLHQEL